MINIVDIKEAIVKKLKYIKGVNIPAQEIRSGFDKPAFFVQIMPLGTVSNSDTQDVSINVYIHYFPESKTELENLKMIDKLNSLFVTTLKVKEDILTLYDKNSDIEDNVLQFGFTIRYTEVTPIALDEEIENYECMEELDMNFN